MAHAARQRPKVFWGTVEEVFSHRDEIPDGATLELKVFVQPPSDANRDNGQSAESEVKPLKQLKAWRMFDSDRNAVDDFLRRKHEDTLREDERFKRLSTFWTRQP